MTDPLHGAADTPAPPADAAAPADSALSEAGKGPALATGKRWRNFQIGAPAPAHGPGAHEATDAGSMEPALVAVLPLGPGVEARRQTWQVLDALPAGNLVPLRDAVEDDEWRYEVFAAPNGTSLRDWIACHQIGLAEIETIVRQLTLLLEAMHAAGVVHLRIRPDTIFINEAERNLEVILGGLGVATLHSQAELIPIEVDPYYAPPEAAGLFRHKPGPELCAWDWWSLGRVVQELVHGKHVYGLLFERDVSGNPPELKSRAETALLDRDPSGVRAGAVELLPDNVSPRLRTLLRGLLASSRDGRWGSDQVLHWLQRETVPDRYDLPRDARLFVWRRRAFTVPEAAEFFLQPDYALEGQAQFFPATGDPAGTMLAFLQELPQLKGEAERVGQVLALADSAAWQSVPLVARRAAVAGLAWLTLAPASARPPLCVQRWRVDPAGLQEMFSDAPPTESVALALALTSAVYRRAVEGLDATAGRTLALLADAGFKAAEEAGRAGWLPADDWGGQTRMLRFALDAEKDLIARRDRLRMSYATNQDPRLAALLAADKPDRLALVLLAYTGERAKDFGYVTHADWAQARLAELRARAAHLAAAAFWQRLLRVAAASPALLGSWPIFATLWAIPFAFCVAGEAWMAAALVALSAGLVRWGAHAGVNRLRARFAPETAPWTWTTRPQRCSDEAERALQSVVPPATLPLLGEIERMRSEIKALRITPAPALPPRPPRLVAFWCGATLSTLAPVAVVVAMFVHAQTIPPAPALVERPKPVAPDVASAVELAAAQQIYEEFNDGFGRRPRGPLRAWDVPAKAPVPLSVRRMAPASPVQRAYAKVGAELLLEPYPRNGLAVTIAVPVLAGREPGLVLYDSAERELVDGRTFFVPPNLTDRTWYWIGNRRVVYLGVPERLAAQISLAPP
jgi:hypothetical protein